MPFRTEQRDDRVRIIDDGAVLAEYVYRPTDVQLESPRPYLSPIRTRGGELVSLFRPHDHVWHKGIAWSLPVVGDENFWGGPTFVAGEGYVQSPNNGTQLHRGFESESDAAAGASARIVELLDWVTEAGETVFDERRIVGATVLAADAWLLAFETRMQNVSGRSIPIGSPTTRGRENAGYGGLFWRGPRSFTGGTLLAPGVAGGDELRGTRSPWMGFSGRHDGSGAASTIVMIDDPGNVQHPTAVVRAHRGIRVHLPGAVLQRGAHRRRRRDPRAAVRGRDRRRRERSGEGGLARRRGLRSAPRAAGGVVSMPAFPGATSVSVLEVYGGRAPDGLAGGTPHLHTVSAEAYLVIAGRGRLQTVDGSGFAEHPLEPGSLLWFEPGVIHRVVNESGDLEVRVIMQNAGLPEAGDAVMTFTDDVLADPERYRAAATLPGADRPEGERLAAALARRDLAVEGFLALFDDGRVDAERLDAERLARLHARAVALVAPRASEWRERWQTGALAEAHETGRRIDALEAGRDPGLADARVAASPTADAFGMCGRLRRYETTPSKETHA